MISYIVASHKKDVLERNLLSTLKKDDGDEILVIENASSIATAYNIGVRSAKNKIKCFIHHDILVVNTEKLRTSLIEHCTDEIGIVGVIGSKDASIVPWWDKSQCGNVIDTRLGLINFSKGNEECALLDGLLLATSQNVEFDETYKGFHLYDHDICRQMLENGLKNFCLADGYSLVVHNTSGPTDTSRLVNWDENVKRYKEKWMKEVVSA